MGLALTQSGLPIIDKTGIDLLELTLLGPLAYRLTVWRMMALAVADRSILIFYCQFHMHCSQDQPQEHDVAGN